MTAATRATTRLCRCGCGRAVHCMDLALSCYDWWRRHGRPGHVPLPGTRQATARTFPPGLNEARTLTAAARDVTIAAGLVTRAWLSDREHGTAAARITHPDWSWAQIGASLGLSKDQAVSAFRRASVKAGLR